MATRAGRASSAPSTKVLLSAAFQLALNQVEPRDNLLLERLVHLRRDLDHRTQEELLRATALVAMAEEQS